jgi:hypothetical protein
MKAEIAQPDSAVMVLRSACRGIFPGHRRDGIVERKSGTIRPLFGGHSRLSVIVRLF